MITYEELVDKYNKKISDAQTACNVGDNKACKGLIEEARELETEIFAAIWSK